MKLFPPLAKRKDLYSPWYRDPRVWTASSSFNTFLTFLIFAIWPTQKDSETWFFFLWLHSPVMTIELLEMLFIFIKYPFLSDIIVTDNSEIVFVPFHQNRSYNLIPLISHMLKITAIVWYAPLLLIYGDTTQFRILMVTLSYSGYFYNSIWTCITHYQTHVSYDNWDQATLPCQWEILWTKRSALAASAMTSSSSFSSLAEVKKRIYGGSLRLKNNDDDDNDDDDSDTNEHAGLLQPSGSFVITSSIGQAEYTHKNPSFSTNIPHRPFNTIPNDGNITTTTTSNYTSNSSCGIATTTTEVYLDPSIHAPDLSQTGSDVYDNEVPLQSLDIPSLIQIAGYPTVEPSTTTSEGTSSTTGSDTNTEYGFYSPPVFNNAPPNLDDSDDLP